MKNRLTVLFILFVLSLISCSEKETIRHSELLNKHKYPSDYMYLQRSYPHGKIDKEAFRRGFAKAQEMKTKQQPISGQGEWKNAGPINIGGRIVDIEGIGSTLYVGAASGGIFKTEDRGINWTPIFDNEITLSIGDMAISNTNNQVIYVGTGEANAGGGSLAYDGEGMYKTIDGGDSWTRIGLEDVGSIGRVAVDPSNDNIVYVAAMGTLFSENIERGIFRTRDGGDTWEHILFSSPKTGGIDVIVDPDNSNIIYAAMWERERLLHDRTYGGPTSGIYKSVDGGDTWTNLVEGLPTMDKGRIGLAIAPSNPNILYATIAETGGSLLGIFKTENGGLAWEVKSTNGVQSVPFMWWFGRMKVHPQNPDIVYHIGFTIDLSLDGGDNWQNAFSGAHVDQHEIWIDSSNPDDVYLGNDGGVYFSDDGGLSHSKIDNMPITQFYRCEVDFLQPARLYGGSQDNSTIRTLTGANDDWALINGGDGFTALVDPTDNNFVYATSQFGNMRRSVDGGFIFMNGTNGIENSEPNNWNTPYVFDPSNPEIMYYGTNHLYRSTDRAESWTKISDDLSNGPYQGINPFGTLTSISVSPFNPNQILVGTDDGNVWITNDLGNNWEDLSDQLPNRWVTSITHHPTEENQFFVTFSGYRYGENSAYAYSMNYPSDEWISISGGLPQVPINDFIIIRMTGQRVVATDVGVFISEENTEWELLGDELPNVIITDLDYHEPEDKLIVATYGRSMYTYTFDRSISTVNEQNAILMQITPNPASTYLNVKINEDVAVKQSWVTTSDGKKIDIYLKTNLSDDGLRMDISIFPEGKYILSILTEKGISSHVFVVVK